MKRNAKRTLRRGMKGGNLINLNNTGYNYYNSYLSKQNNKPIPISENIQKLINDLPDPHTQNNTPHKQPEPPPQWLTRNDGLLQPPQSQEELRPQLPVKTKNKRRNSVKPYVPPTFKFGQQPLPYQPPPRPPQAPPRPPQAPPRKQKRLALVEQRQLILTQILNKINYSFKLIQVYLVEIKNKLKALGYHFDAKELEQDIVYMKKNIEKQIIPSTTYYFQFKNIFNNSYTEIYDYAIRNIMDMIKVINNEKTSYFVIFERTKDKNKKLEEIVKLFEIIKKEYKKIYNIVSELFDSLKFLQA